MPDSFLLIGISFDRINDVVGEEAAARTMAAVNAGLTRNEKQFKEAGLDFELIQYGASENMDRLERKLAEKEWKGVTIGFGIRGTKQFTPQFEKLVNTVKDKSPNSKLLFNTVPDDTMDAVKRWFPVN